ISFLPYSDSPAALFDNVDSHHSTTSIPIDRAVPATVRDAASILAAVRSLTLVLAISSTCLRVTLPTLFLFGSAEPFSIPAARSSRIEAGGLLVTKVKERSA